MARLEDKVALITGAGSGIGRESAILFAREGAAVVCVDLNEDSAHGTEAEIKSAGGRAIAIRADVAIGDDCREMVEAAERAFGKLNVLFNNAGIMHADDDDAQETTEHV